MSSTAGRHRRTRTLSLAGTTAAALGVAGYLALPSHDARASSATVVVSSTAALESAVRDARAGTVIQVRGGTYYPADTLKSSADGTASSRITLSPYGSEKVKIDGSKLPAGSWLAAIQGDYWTVSGMQFQRSPAHGVVVTSSSGGIFRNLTTNDNGDSGFTLRGENCNDNLIANLDSYGNYDPAHHGQNADGLAVKFGSGSGNKVTGARLFHNADDGMDLWQWASAVTVEHSWAYGNGKNRWSDPAFEGNGNGFKLGGGGATAAHLVNNNATWDNASHGFTENSNTGAIAVNRNTAYRNADTGFYFATGRARLAANLAVGGAAEAKLGGSTVSARNNWDPGIPIPAVNESGAASAQGARKTDGSLPATDFLRVSGGGIGSTMD
ncbi:right-handed parallel beta-helix repeat-containing protein [Streptomyces sp. NPDC017993]|uniref:right-handed parallel beta-helix repeat-containing protein n=1 Tax=Streptomyces sp. NPDC017993 TaxID=3365027 RepID=UPI0037B1FB2D